MPDAGSAPRLIHLSLSIESREPGQLLKLIWGNDVEPALRPVLIVGFAGSLAGSAAWTFIGIWAVDDLDASSAQLGLYFVGAAVLSAATGYGGGHISDHLGRRPVILF